MTCKCICCENIDLKFSPKKTEQGHAPCKLDAKINIGNATGKSLMSDRECNNYTLVNDDELKRRRVEYKRVSDERKQLYSTKKKG